MAPLPSGDDPRLKVTLGRLSLPNPIVCGSGEPVMTEAGIRAALAAGAAGVIAKSVNEQPAAARQLDHADYAWLDHRGAVSARPDPLGSSFCRSGLSPRAAAEWFGAVAALDREAAATGRFVAASIVLGGREGAIDLVRLAAKAGVRVFELNVGAPHAPEARRGTIELQTEPADVQSLVDAVRAAAPEIILWVKLTGLATNLPALAEAAVAGGADTVVMMGRFLGMVPDLDTLAPVLGSSAAYGGPWAVPIVCRYLALSRKAVGAARPLVGTNGVRSGADLMRMALAGASAVEMLTVVMQEGFGALARIRTELTQLLAARGLSFQEIVGTAADRLRGYADQPLNAGRWRAFVPAETLAGEGTR